MTQAANLKPFEQFQGRVLRTALLLCVAAPIAGLVICRGFSPVVTGLLLGGLGSLASYRYRLWTLRRLAACPTDARAFRLPLLGSVRLLILGAALGLAAWVDSADDGRACLFSAAGMLFVSNVAIIIEAARSPRDGSGE